MTAAAVFGSIDNAYVASSVFAITIGYFRYGIVEAVDSQTLVIGSYIGQKIPGELSGGVYAQQTAVAKEKGESNCPLCAIGHDANHTKIWDLKDMDADHVSAWSKGGATDISNCQMLCKMHNRAKGNR